jgi:hypothetical protein
MDEGYSTILDAILFLAMISVCVIILSPVILGHMQERYVTDCGVRSLTSDSMETLQSSKVDDVFTYHILGDWIQKIEDYGNVDNTSRHILDVTEDVLLSRKNQHKSVMELAAEDAACQFILDTTIMDKTVRMKLDPFTGEYDTAIASFIDESIRSKLDARYDYEFNLRWAPFANVPIEGNVTAGGPHRKDAESSSMVVTMPYTTQMTGAYLDGLNDGDLDNITSSLERYNSGFKSEMDTDRLRDEIGENLSNCLNRTVRAGADEVWKNTLGSDKYIEEMRNPLNVLKKFINNDTLYGEVLDITGIVGNDVLAESAMQCNAGDMDMMTGLIVDEAKDGNINTAATRAMVVDLLKSRYDPAKATATLYVWVK